ncbi:hypothetical protein M3Y99_01856700 [Aphelenchoides fujianensis]|nr:hypothetical protein M3Y99_01856700 [Aphelenchoides fujianensis]
MLALSSVARLLVVLELSALVVAGVPHIRNEALSLRKRGYWENQPTEPPTTQPPPTPAAPIEFNPDDRGAAARRRQARWPPGRVHDDDHLLAHPRLHDEHPGCDERHRRGDEHHDDRSPDHPARRRVDDRRAAVDHPGAPRAPRTSTSSRPKAPAGLDTTKRPPPLRRRPTKWK